MRSLCWARCDWPRNGSTTDEYDEVASFHAKNARRAQSLPKDSGLRRSKMRLLMSQWSNRNRN
jgi:hypothetical protein